MQAEVDAVNEANGASEEARTAQVIEAKRARWRRQTAALAEEKRGRVEAEAAAVAATRSRCADLERQIMEADVSSCYAQPDPGTARQRACLCARQAGARRARLRPRPFESASGGDRRGPRLQLGDGSTRAYGRRVPFDKVFGPASKQETFSRRCPCACRRAGRVQGVPVLVRPNRLGQDAHHARRGRGSGGGHHPQSGAQGSWAPRRASVKLRGTRWSASYVEIYVEQIRDLLKPGADHDEKLSIAVAPAGGARR